MKFGRSEIITLCLLLLAVVGAMFLAYRIVEERKDATSDAGKTLSDTISGSHFTTLEGDPFSFDAYRDMVRVVNVWATWTPFSKDELTMLNDAAAKYAGSDVVIIAINRTEAQDRVKSYLARFGPFDALTFVQDQTDTYYKSIEGFSMPETIVYDKDGTIILHRRGPITARTLEDSITQARTSQ